MLPTQWFELTFENNPDQIVEEFIKKYKNCWVWFRQSKDTLPLLVLFREYNSGEFIFLHKDTKISCVLNTEVEILANFPSPGGFTHKKNYFVLHRIPARQYRKAPNSENCQITNPLNGLGNIYGVSSAALDNDILHSAYKKDTLDYKTIVTNIKKPRSSWRGAAITDEFGITSGQEKPILWYMDVPIGYATEKQIKLGVHSMYQEVSDMLRNTNNTEITIENI